MATLKPKLECFRLKLISKETGDKKHFLDFVKKSIAKSEVPLSGEESFKMIYDHFINNLTTSHAKDDKIKKQIKIVRTEDNKYLEYLPSYDSSKCIISGVINGGQYGRDRILGDTTNPDETSQISQSKSILQYYYFLLYLPLDHYEGCLLIHSNSKEETITNIFRHYISKIFDNDLFNNLAVEVYCPESFQKEYRKNSVLKYLSFKTTFIEADRTDGEIKDFFNNYNISIRATPKDKNISPLKAEKILRELKQKIFGTDKQKKNLDEFENIKMSTENTSDHSTKTFEWNTHDQEFAPVIYLQNRIAGKNPDETPNFSELKTYCENLLKDSILPEIRPDLNAKKIK